jgi:hypothetical protein
MSEFTPSLDEVRAIYALGTPAHHVSIAGSYAEFDRAIAKVRADAKVEALREAVSDFESSVGIGEFREQTMRDNTAWTHVDEAWELQGPYMDWLRNRADNLEAS